MSTVTNPVAALLAQIPLSKQETPQAPAPPSENGRTDQPAKQDTYGKTILMFALVLFSFVLIKNAWLSDDGYITLRTVYNFIHGYGLTWNIDERVQTYTHPLWIFLLSGSYFFLRSIYFSSLLLSIVISLLAVALFAFRLTPSPIIALVGVTMLAASKSFIDYSTSGLENPLTHLLIVLFALIFLQNRQSKRSLLWLSLLGCLMILTRMDTVLLFLPALAVAWYQAPHPRLKALRTVMLAFLPFVAWELFSLFYYGFLFPNTAYAKLNTGISTGQMIKQGIVYLISSFTFDPLLFLTIVSTAVLVLTLHNWKSLPLLLGMALYLGYVVRVGGDFMAGRFLTPAFLMAVILLLNTIPSSAKLIYVAIFVAVVALGFQVPNSRWYVINTSTQYSMASNPSGVVDEHEYYANATGLLNFERTEIFPNSSSTQKALLIRQDQDKVTVYGAIGYFGYEAGPQVHVLDDMALGDPLLARLPLSQVELGIWRIGHFHREVPPGYLETLQTGINMIQDPGLAQYYAALHDVVSGPLFSGQRLLEIWNFQTGAYNGLLHHYIQTLPTPPATPQPAPSPTSDVSGIWLERRAILF